MDDDRRDKLISAVLNVELHLGAASWERPCLFALVERDKLVEADPLAAAKVEAVPPGALVPVAQEALPEGDLDDVLAMITWPEQVAGCVLSRRLFVLPQEVRGDVGQDVVRAAQHPEVRIARLTVGVLRDGTHVSYLRLWGTDDLLEDTETADDLVAALLSTL
ncbi:PPA1309 family protein [Actinomadura madurae]|uniref:PPA1309 family protein n=1 Tax=Actinomadura madurae TaxID=1993 RepID=UPI0020263DD8|nr:PPA1309 family protein [Actinomadura madurae]MCP9948063.1 PPA1309 family protein [Actinomadura madurae]MCP9964829.1 PPA1309 family protein [Actinomadura madurae]MCP9977318.1 PPA1309 family protein [Actinomadura madurae]MCQ0011174.1 PPA1309 family protein [Actinomadura madurae]MCQ0013501.1 PPA1309 family protein [Actinomadura madurae]